MVLCSINNRDIPLVQGLSGRLEAIVNLVRHGQATTACQLEYGEVQMRNLINVPPPTTKTLNFSLSVVEVAIERKYVEWIANLVLETALRQTANISNSKSVQVQVDAINNNINSNNNTAVNCVITMRYTPSEAWKA
jgi:hypothetical protein